MTVELDYIAEKPSFEQLCDLRDRLMTALQLVTALADEDDTPQRASDLFNCLDDLVLDAGEMLTTNYADYLDDGFYEAGMDQEGTYRVIKVPENDEVQITIDETTKVFITTDGLLHVTKDYANVEMFYGERSVPASSGLDFSEGYSIIVHS
jgi:hypothetical protein